MTLTINSNSSFAPYNQNKYDNTSNCIYFSDPLRIPCSGNGVCVNNSCVCYAGWMSLGNFAVIPGKIYI